MSTKTVLMIEDNPDHILLVEIAAKKVDPGVRVRPVTSGEAAIAYLSSEPPFDDPEVHPRPAVVLLDLLLPGMGGFEVLDWASREDGLEEVPRVVLSSSVNPGDRERALALGAVEFHSKPSDVRELGDTVGAILRRWVL